MSHDHGHGHRHKGDYYFRLHGPITPVAFDSTQGDANHIHALWRDDALAARCRSGLMA